MNRSKGEHKLKNIVGIGHSWKHAKNELGIKIPKNLYTAICYRFNQELSNLIIYNGFEYVLPCRLGVLRVAPFKPKIKIKNGKLDKRGLRPDWNATIEMYQKRYPDIKGRKNIQKLISELSREAKSNGKAITLVYHFNEHTGGWAYKWKWDLRNSNAKGKSIYKFKCTKQNRLDLSKHVKTSTEVNYYI